MTADDLGPLFDRVDIHTDDRGRHWDRTGREYRLVEDDVEVSYEPISTPAAAELAPTPPRPRAPIVFLDTETTGLGEDDEIWEIAAIYRHPDGTLWDLEILVQHDFRKVRHLDRPFRIDWATRYDPRLAISKPRAATQLANFVTNCDPDLPPAVVMGANPSFDIRHITKLLTHLDPDEWPDGVRMHYRPVDIGAIAYGYLQAIAQVTAPDPDVHELLERGLPWSSDEVSRALGVDPDDFARHTAMGDVRWVMAIWDRITGGAR